MRIAMQLVFVALVTSLWANAALAVDANARVVELRNDCTGVSNCFTSTNALTGWLWGGGAGDRANPPSATDRVVVLAGPGTFDRFECDGSGTARGWVSIIGAGREFTRFSSNDGSSGWGVSAYCNGGINAHNCNELNFQDLTAYGSHTGAFWVGGGSSTWSDVDVIAGGAEAVTSCGLTTSASLAWYDINGVGEAPVHYFFGSRIISKGVAPTNLFDWVVGIDSTTPGSEIWFYGGDIVAQPTQNLAFKQLTAVHQTVSLVETFGTSIRAKVGAATSATFAAGFKGVHIQNAAAAKFHSHGGIIAVDASASAGNVNVVAISGNGHAHTHDTAFSIKAGGTGTRTRIANATNKESPFLWNPSTNPPIDATANGADLFVDTAAGPSNNEAHLMVYDTSCSGSGGPWRDMADGLCRP